MKLYSQHDPAYDYLPLGNSSVTVHGYGCFLVSIATLFQVPPTELLKVKGAFNKKGELVSSTLAKYCGGKRLSATKEAPVGWSIGVTDFYRNVGYPTHFFLVNVDKGLMVDPLNYPAKLEPIGYEMKQYRPFTGSELDVRVFELIDYQRKLKRAENALKWARGTRFGMLKRLIDRLRKKVG